MREKDFENIAFQRIEKAAREEDAETLGAYLCENYTPEIRNAAIEALGELASEESITVLLDRLFSFTLDVEGEAEIIRVLSEILTEEDMDQVRVEYNVQTDKRALKLYTVLGRCVRL